MLTAPRRRAPASRFSPSQPETLSRARHCEKEAEMPHVISRDGTRIAYERHGAGEAVVLIDGATSSRAMGFMPRLAGILADRFSVTAYDRRGRGDSDDTSPFAVKREIEDLEALVDEAGGSAAFFGISSGAALGLEAAVELGDKVTAVALYEPPYNDEDAPLWRDYRRQLDELLAADRRGDAIELFMRFVGVPSEQIGPMRESPMWPALEAVAPTLAYDAAVLGKDRAVPTAPAARLEAPALVMNGSASYPFMRTTARALAAALPSGHYRELAGQRHDVELEVIAPVLAEFFGDAAAARRATAA
jgi:pimeloyl-ACP methyl ester carboxylesterase